MAARPWLAGEVADRSARRIPVMRAQPADSLVDFVGVNTHLNFRTAIYGNTGRVVEALQELGVRHIRDHVVRDPVVVKVFKELARSGIRVQGVCGALTDPETMDEVLGGVAANFRRPERVFSAFEGINEPNNDGPPWIAETRRKSIALFNARRRFGLQEIPILAPALAEVARGGPQGGNTLGQAARLGSLRRYVDFGNMHVYPRGLPPSSAMDYFRSAARHVSRDLPIWCTEGGYFNAMEFRGGANPVPEAVSAAYAPQQILTHVKQGTRRFYRYELLDEPNPTPTDREGTLGMIRTDNPTWTAKPDFAPVQHLLATMADPGRLFATRPLEMSLTNRPARLRGMAFAKRDGTHVLALWRDVELWDTDRERLTVPSLTRPLASVDLTLGSRRRVEVQHLTTLGRSTVERTRRTRIGLTAGVTLVSIT